MLGRRASQRGTALITTMGLSVLLLMLIAGVLYYAGQQRIRSVAPLRKLARVSCANSGLAIARTYFSSNYPWDNFLSNPDKFNPVTATWMTAASKTAAVPGPTLRGTNPELFFDLDGDGVANPDVYIYIRDNEDEPFGVSPNYQRDNDQNAIIGALCISSTMVPRLPSGAIDTSKLTAESLLSYDLPGDTYTGQAGGAGGNANVNRR